MPDQDDIRARLDALGRRRARIDAQEAELMEDTRKVLSDADGLVPVSESARRLRIHRTTVYRVYGPKAA